MKSFANFILMENLLYNVPNTTLSIKTLADTLFNPKVRIVERSCNTKLGTSFDPIFLSEEQIPDRNGNRITPFNFAMPVIPLGSTDVPQVFTQTEINQAVATKVRKVYVYHPSSCVSKGGICSVCAYSSYLFSTAKVLKGYPVTTTYEYFDTPSATFEDIAPKIGSIFQIQASYGRSKEFLSPSQKALFAYIAQTYSGSLLGIRNFNSPILPISTQLYRQILNQNIVAKALSDLTRMKGVPSDILEYINRLEDVFEQSLMIVVTYVMYAPQQTAVITTAPDIVIP